jgi:hypothetical protein
MKRTAVFLGIISLSVVWTAGSASAQTPRFTLRVDAGGLISYTDRAGNQWQPDKDYAPGGGYGFQGGDMVDHWESTKITGTPDPRLYQTERYDMSAFIAEAPEGKYTVRLHFVETYEDISVDGPRVFDVKIQGVQVAMDVDIAGEAGGVRKALVREFTGIPAREGVLKIDFIAKQLSVRVSAIEILAE